MKTIHRSALLAFSSLALAALACGVGCTVTPGATGSDGGDAATGDSATDAGACANTGTGTLTINVTGLPAGVAAKVKLTGPDGTSDVDATKTINDAAAGSYSVAAEKVTKADAIVRNAYEPTITTSSVCVGDTESKTLEVSYAEIPTSNKLWMSNANGAAGILGFASASLGASGSPAATIAAQGPAGTAVAFDRDGNMWASGATTAEPELIRFSAASLATPGPKTPDRLVQLGFSCGPRVGAIAFDSSGNLWVSSPCEKNVRRLTPDQLASGSPTAAVQITGFDSPRALAFDSSGNMWVTDIGAGKVLRYDAARLSASTADAPSLSISTKNAADADIPADALAFDGTGNLWATNFGGNVVFKLATADLAGTGTKTVTAAVEVTVGVGALLETMAFDESGGLWLTYGVNKVARVAPAQLGVSTGSGDPTIPATVINSSDIAYAGGIAFYPAAANLPLYSRLP